MLTDKVTELETLVVVNNDISGSNTDGLLPEDTVPTWCMMPLGT